MQKRIHFTIFLLLSIFVFLPAVHAGWSVNKTTIVDSTVVGAASNTYSDISFAEARDATLSDTDDVDTTGDLTSGSASVSDIASIYEIEVGMWVIDDSDEVPVDTTVESIDSNTAITLSAAATGTTNDANLTFIPTSCDTVTVTALGGITTGATVDNVAVASLDSSTQATLESGITKTTTETQEVDVLANYDSITVTVKIVADSSATSASVFFYAMHQDSVDTDAFNEDGDGKTYTSIGGLTKTYIYKVSLSTAPKFRVVINNLTTESGADDDITVTVTYAGYSS